MSLLLPAASACRVAVEIDQAVVVHAGITLPLILIGDRTLGKRRVRVYPVVSLVGLGRSNGLNDTGQQISNIRGVGCHWRKRGVRRSGQPQIITKMEAKCLSNG